MNPLRHVILCLVACASLCATAYGQKATIIEYNGKLYGLVVMPTGQQIVLKEVVILKAPSPNPVTTGAVFVTMIVDGRRVKPDQSSEMIELRDWLDKQDAAKVRRLEFSPDARNEKNEPDQRVAAWVNRIPAGERGQPYVFVTQAKTTDGKHIVLWQGPLTTAGTIIEETKRRAKL